ncbi:MAG: hypothetical protein QXF15_02490 [Candidatus Aenigmatarchaeota archaeon]
MSEDEPLFIIKPFQKKNIDANIYDNFNKILKRMEILKQEEDIKWLKKEKNIEKQIKKLKSDTNDRNK